MAHATDELKRTPPDGLPIFWEVRAAIRRATKSDEYAAIAGVPAFALVDLRRALNRASKEITELLNHSHQWNDDDRCSVCGADGRA